MPLRPTRHSSRRQVPRRSAFPSGSSGGPQDEQTVASVIHPGLPYRFRTKVTDQHVHRVVRPNQSTESTSGFRIPRVNPFKRPTANCSLAMSTSSVSARVPHTGAPEHRRLIRNAHVGNAAAISPIRLFDIQLTAARSRALSRPPHHHRRFPSCSPPRHPIRIERGSAASNIRVSIDHRGWLLGVKPFRGAA